MQQDATLTLCAKVVMKSREMFNITYYISKIQYYISTTYSRLALLTPRMRTARSRRAVSEGAVALR